MTPSEFAVKVLGLRPYGWQFEAMESLGQGWPTSVVAANGSGKTANLVAPLILWFLHEHPRGQVVFTSGSFRQIEKQLWPAVRRFQSLFPAWSFMSVELRTPEGGFAVGFSTDDPGRAEGWHPKVNSETDPVFIIVDEAKTVPNSIFEAFDRCTRKFQLWVSSPGAPRGQFFDSFGKDRKYYWTRRVPSTECPHIEPEKRERDLEKYGADHPVFRSMHEAEFTENVERMVLTPDRLAKAIEAQPQEVTDGEVVAFLDFAAGRDENVLAIRKGNRVRIIKAWVEKDTVQACREFARLLREHQVSPGQAWGDADGLGIVMINDLAEMGCHINKFHGGQAASDPDEYANLIGEVWHVGTREIERGRVNVGVLDPMTFRQLTTRRSEWTDNGRLRIESKDSLGKQGIKSPDRADALLGAICCGSRMTGAVSERSILSSTSSGNDFAGSFVRF